MAKGTLGNEQLVMVALKNPSRAACVMRSGLRDTCSYGGPVQVQQVVKTIDATLLTREQRQALREAVLAAQKLAAE